MDEVIRAMADEIAQIEADREGYPLSRTWDEIYEDAWEMATAAYNAMRDTLVPRAYHLEYAQTGDTGLSRFAGHAADGWTETPLYALPEIDNG